MPNYKSGDSATADTAFVQHNEICAVQIDIAIKCNIRSCGDFIIWHCNLIASRPRSLCFTHKIINFNIIVCAGRDSGQWQLKNMKSDMQ